MSLVPLLQATVRPLLGPLVRRIRLARARRVLMRGADGVTDCGALFDLAIAALDFAPLQHRSEFVALMVRAAELAPRVVVEVGSYAGGTAFLLARAAASDARIVLVDDLFDGARRAALNGFALPGQRVVCLRGDSHSEDMRRRVVAATGGHPVDVLFIDGDHRYEGVSRDFQLYSTLVRPGGLIAFHDIVPDRRTRLGEDTAGDAGGVPRFWAELKGRYGSAASERIDDPEQDACGIGMLYWRP